MTREGDDQTKIATTPEQMDLEDAEARGWGTGDIIENLGIIGYSTINLNGNVIIEIGHSHCR